MRLLIERERSVHAFSRKCGIADSLIRKYLAGGNPGIDKAAVMAEVAGVSLEWLATGRGSMQIDPTVQQTLRTAPLEAAIRIVERWLALHRRTMKPERKAAVVAIIYEIIVQDLEQGRGPMDDQRAETVLKLVA